jgi:hypothetical protein
MPIAIVLLPLLLLLTILLITGMLSVVYGLVSMLIEAVHPHQAPHPGS